MKEIILIAAVSKNNVIGNKGKIPWHIEEDMKHFKELTLKKTVIMGRKTFEALLVKPLPSRKNIVLTRSQKLNYEGVLTAESINKALELCKGDKEIYFIGGEEVYQKALSLANKLEITSVNKSYKGDRFFPEIDSSIWKLIKEEKRIGYSFLTYERQDLKNTKTNFKLWPVK
jgi:dihydrofolate reductase